MAVQEVWLKIEEISNYNPVHRLKDFMKNPGHEYCTISDPEANARTIAALVFREWEENFTVRKQKPLINNDTHEPVPSSRIGTAIYTTPGTTLKIHVQNTDIILIVFMYMELDTE